MSDEFELKCKVNESLHDDFLVLSRQLGFQSKTDFLRYLVKRELYGASSLVQVSRMPGAYLGQEKQ